MRQWAVVSDGLPGTAQKHEFTTEPRGHKKVFHKVFSRCFRVSVVNGFANDQ